MKSHTFRWPPVDVVAMVAIALLTLSIAGCEKESAPPAKPAQPAAAPAEPAEPAPAEEATATVEVAFANVKCPMMGTKIDPTNVPASLIREFKGKKVAFCCAGCPGAWDKLSDEEKESKLKSALAAAP